MLLIGHHQQKKVVCKIKYMKFNGISLQLYFRFQPASLTPRLFIFYTYINLRAKENPFSWFLDIKSLSFWDTLQNIWLLIIVGAFLHFQFNKLFFVNYFWNSVRWINLQLRSSVCGECLYLVQTCISNLIWEKSVSMSITKTDWIIIYILRKFELNKSLKKNQKKKN